MSEVQFCVDELGRLGFEFEKRKEELPHFCLLLANCSSDKNQMLIARLLLDPCSSDRPCLPVAYPLLKQQCYVKNPNSRFWRVLQPILTKHLQLYIPKPCTVFIAVFIVPLFHIILITSFWDPKTCSCLDSSH